MDFLEELRLFQPRSEQEELDRELILEYILKYPKSVLTRTNKVAHMTASSMIFNPSRDKVLMVYHNIYKSWSWTGGHADGEADLFSVAVGEALEETGLNTIRPLTGSLFTVDILPVWRHYKKGAYVNTHLHLNYSYLLEADETDVLHIKEDENSGVQWIPISQLKEFVTEPDMIPIYEKLIKGGCNL